MNGRELTQERRLREEAEGGGRREAERERGEEKIETAAGTVQG